MKTIRELFSSRRPIDRRIEKVIDYYADDEDRLAAEIAEYEATDNVEACFRKFLETYQAGARAGQVTEVGIWVAGFYGSGKSSFTKYLGLALDRERLVHGRPFLDLLTDRLNSPDVKASLRTVATQIPTAVVMLDLGAEQLAESTAATVTNVLYWKVLQLADYSKEKKLAQLEFKLNELGLYDEFKAAYRRAHEGEWIEIHNDPLIGVARASRLLPTILPDDFPDKDSFSKLRFEMADDVRDLARRIIELLREHTGRGNILFLVDEAGQYVAPRGELILNLDGLARNLKELGHGKVWIMATGQQTLTEIVERAAYNTPELNKLRDRFPISIELDARDIREITYRRLLTKSNTGEAELRSLFEASGQALAAHTRLANTALFKADPTIEDFVRYYPLLPQHFEVLMELIRVLARGTGGIGLRSAIRVIQDVLVDTSRILPPDAPKLADRPVGTLACVDDFYVTLRADINKILPHVVSAVDHVERVFSNDGLHLRVAQAVAALQPLEEFPKTAQNIAALLYPGLGHPSQVKEVQQVLQELLDAREIGLIEDPQAGGYLFLSASVLPLQRKRSEYVPTGGELTRVRNQILRNLLEPQPAAKLENVRNVRAAVRTDKHWLIGDREEIRFRLVMVSARGWDDQRRHLLEATAQQTEYQNVIVWLFQQDDVAEDILPEIRKSERLVSDVDERTADRDVAQYLRSERRLAERNRERVETRLHEALLAGTFIFRGKPTPVRQEADTLEAASRSILAEVAGKVFNQYHLVKIRPRTRLAAQFLEVERMDRMPRDRDPLGLVVVHGGAPRIDVNHPALAETLRAFKARLDDTGGGRLTGKSLQGFFADVPYGWSKDAVRYLFAALLVAGEIEVHTAGQTFKTSGPAAVEVFKSTLAFNKVGIGLRDSKVSLEVQDLAARRLQSLFGEPVSPLEDRISSAARKHLPRFLDHVRALPDRLRLLQLPGEERAKTLIAELGDLLKGDASDAPLLLGVPDSSIPGDIEWARATTRVLDQGGEHDIRRARALLQNLAEIVRLYPKRREALATEEEVETLRTVLRSERFHEQLADVRGIVSAARTRCRAVYAEELAQYRTALDDMQNTLESRADWVLLSDADRADIVSQLETTLPENPTDANLLTDFRALLTRASGLAQLQKELEARVERLAPDVEPEPETIEELAARRLDEKEAELAESQKLKYLGAMASAMAHGLNQPIGVIRAVSSASLSDFHSGLLSLEETEPRFRKIMTQTDRLAHIIENMRAFARGDWQKREKVDLRQVVAQMCEMFADQFQNRNIELDCSGARVESALAVRANPVQLQEVLINLLTNARDAVEGQDDATVRVECWRLDNGYCGFSVEDNGPGLPSEYRQQIFTPFVTTKSSEKGTGLGLYTSWRMIDALGGQLRHEDRPGGGARFAVELPPINER